MKADSITNELEAWKEWLLENNAEEISLDNISEVSDLCDYALIATVKNTRHMSHLSEAAMSWAKSLNITLINADGLNNKEWVVLDFGNYLIHLFLSEAREKYSLNDLWSELKNSRNTDNKE